jgi:hypothetical protein
LFSVVYPDKNVPTAERGKKKKKPVNFVDLGGGDDMPQDEQKGATFNIKSVSCVLTIIWQIPPLQSFGKSHHLEMYSKIPWYPTLLFQRENASASF